MPIRRLPAHVVNQIAAGEVVERPASVVKELVENALDAGATRVEVRIEGGGRERIEVVDDGGGIPAEELTLAVSPHATSKIGSAEDLVGIASYGFRGEALASVGSVSRLVVASRAASADHGASIEVDHGAISNVRPAASAAGTRVEVHQLFGQVPARRKFLRSEPTEAGRVTDALEWLALGRPQVAFTLHHNGRRTLDLPAVEDARLRVEAVLGKEFAGTLLPVELSGGGAVAIWGWIGRPEHAKASAGAMRLAMNGRPITDRGLLHAVREAYRGLVEPGRTPAGFIAIDVDPREVDVNVHPAKTEVRFRQPALIHSALLRALRSALQQANLVPSLALGGASMGGVAAHAPASSAPAVPSWPGAARSGAAPGERGFDAASMRSALQSPAPALARIDSPDEAPLLAQPRPATRFLQAGKAWLVTSDADGLVVIDQHALHERVMFEELRAALAAGSLASQPLLVPIPIELDGERGERLEASQELLQRLGFEVRWTGPRGAALWAEPLFLSQRRVESAGLIQDWLARDRAATEDGEAVLAEVLDLMACKAAVKAGDSLSDAEIAALLRDLERVERSTNCPHGRPTAMRIPYRELERRFGRG
jgi:DNA mismatch repair protein MutL